MYNINCPQEVMKSDSHIKMHTDLLTHSLNYSPASQSVNQFAYFSPSFPKITCTIPDMVLKLSLKKSLSSSA